MSRAGRRSRLLGVIARKEANDEYTAGSRQDACPGGHSGSGYAGLAAAIQLAARLKRRESVQVTLVNAQERFTERLRLHLTATGQPLAELSIPELLEGTGVRFVCGWVTAVDAEAKTVRVDDSRVLHYDTLVYGLGSVADTAAVPGSRSTRTPWTAPRTPRRWPTGWRGSAPALWWSEAVG
ncbi:FAD-dependent oxidoreductase [Micromonospora sp. M12]